ncbi:MAG: hypothetical protein RB191_03265 [Terriglobia bacterium]|nr:hypothetical protein [Terriglobia bacterium]
MHALLALRYLGQWKKTRVTEQSAMQSMHELQAAMGQVARPMPTHIREVAEWAEGRKARMRKKEGRK